MANYGYQGDERFAPISAWGYFGYTILFAIPIVGFICLIVFSVSDKNINRRSFARSFWCSTIIALIVVGILMATGTIGALSSLGSARAEGLLGSIGSLFGITEDADDGELPKLADSMSGETTTVKINGVSCEVHVTFKDAMDAYETFFDRYVELMQDPNPDPVEYAQFLLQYADAMQQIDRIDEDEMTDGDLAYYTDVMLRVNEKLLLVANEMGE